MTWLLVSNVLWVNPRSVTETELCFVLGRVSTPAKREAERELAAAMADERRLLDAQREM